MLFRGLIDIIKLVNLGIVSDNAGDFCDISTRNTCCAADLTIIHVSIASQSFDICLRRRTELVIWLVSSGRQHN